VSDDKPIIEDASVLTGEDGQRVLFDRALGIGRHPSNDLVLSHPEVSGYHALIEWEPRGWRLLDLGSSNGTTVNGRRIQGPKILSIGDVIRLGGVSAWKVVALAEPDATDPELQALGLEPTVRPEVATYELDLHLAFDGPGTGTIRVVESGGEWTVRTRQRFVLLYLLAQAAGGWVKDEDLKVKLWGRLGSVDLDRSALNKLIHDTRRMFVANGTDGRILEKRRGMTRLKLDPAQLHAVPSAHAPAKPSSDS